MTELELLVKDLALDTKEATGGDAGRHSLRMMTDPLGWCEETIISHRI